MPLTLEPTNDLTTANGRRVVLFNRLSRAQAVIACLLARVGFVVFYVDLAGSLRRADAIADLAPSFCQGAMGFSIDEFIAQFNPPFPNHLKIDVDGIEDKIVAGARRTLADPRVRSISIELEADRVKYTLERLGAAGLTLVSKRHAEMFEGTRFAHVYNYRFERTSS